uniref:Uncharacterized protein n=1 Tax=viral metagenome TaxID=1070528 RepID=A0A6C0BNZ6_9ZZZZ
MGGCVIQCFYFNYKKMKHKKFQKAFDFFMNCCLNLFGYFNSN